MAVKFNIGGDQGLNVLAAGYPISIPFACESGMPLDDIEQTVTASSSSLAYDPATGTYIYNVEDGQGLGRHLPPTHRQVERWNRAHGEFQVQIDPAEAEGYERES